MKYPLYIMFCALTVLMASSVCAKGTANKSAENSTDMIVNGGSVPLYTASNTKMEQGEKLYDRRCGGCHSLDNNRIGPRHRGVYGSKAGSVPDFNYSKALQKLDVIWTDETLDRWLKNPTAFAEGTSMGFRLRKANEREAIIQYLKSISATSEADMMKGKSESNQ